MINLNDITDQELLTRIPSLNLWRFPKDILTILKKKTPDHSEILEVFNAVCERLIIALDGKAAHIQKMCTDLYILSSKWNPLQKSALLQVFINHNLQTITEPNDVTLDLVMTLLKYGTFEQLKSLAYVLRTLNNQPDNDPLKSIIHEARMKTRYYFIKVKNIDENRKKTPPLIPATAFTLGNEIGAGSYSNVYQAEHQGNKVAVKKLKTQPTIGCTSHGCEVLKQLEKETYMMFAARSEHVINIIAVCLSPLSFVMEYATETLKNKLHFNKDPIEWHTRLIMASQIASAVAVLHAQHMIHHDIKSLNILVDEKGNLKLADFGLAEYESQQVKGLVQGSWPYLPPEAARLSSNGILTQAHDLYSLGSVFWEIAMRKGVPYAAESSQHIKIYLANNRTPRWDESISYPAPFKALVFNLWSTNPKDRPNAVTTKTRLSEMMSPSIT